MLVGSNPWQDYPAGLVFILVYRLAIDARTQQGVMMWLAENIQACLRIFRQLQHQWLVRDILHLPQGVFYCFCLMAQIEVQEVQGVQGVQIRSIRNISQNPC